MLKLDHISFSYDQKLVLNGIDLSLKAGEHLSVVGESGSGKTTLLKLIYGEYDLDSGKIFWKETEILGPKYNLVVGYDFMKYVAQEFDLMPYISVEENVGKFLSNFYPEEKQERIDELTEVIERSMRSLHEKIQAYQLIKKRQLVKKFTNSVVLFCDFR